MNVFTLKIKLFLLSFTLLLSFGATGQNYNGSVCGTVTSSESLNYLNTFKSKIITFEEEYRQLASRSSKSSTSKNIGIPVINSIPVKAHIVNASNGTGGLNISELHSAIANLNNIYKDAFLEFFLCDGINFINNDDFYNHFEKSKESELTNGNYTSGVINIYFTNYVEITHGNSLCGYANTFGGPDVIVMNNGCATNGSSLAHEMGHFFSLLHTHGPSNTKLTTELVDSSNCDTDGDQICDTPADPQLSTSNVNSDCFYIGTQTDINGDTFTPDTMNLMSYSRSSCKSHFSPQQLARIYAFYKSARNYFECPSFNINITADNNQECGDSLTVNFTNNSIGAVAWLWDIDGDGIIDYSTKNPTHTYTSGIYDVTLTISKELGFEKSYSNLKVTNSQPETKIITKTFSQFIKVGSMEGLNLNEDFEDFEIANDKGWSAIDVSGNGYHWYPNSGNTVTNGTGPSIDNSNLSTSGTYIYAEASGALTGDEADFISPCMSINSTNAEFSFNYHMFGANIGELHVDVETSTGDYIQDVIPAIYGQQQTSQSDSYLNKTIDLSAFANKTINIHFRAIRGASWDGDIALDDVSITGDVILLPVNDNKQQEEVKIYPNPVTSSILHINTNDLLNYKITNMMGQVFAKGEVTDSQINVGNLSKGTYFLVLKGNRSHYVKKFVK